MVEAMMEEEEDKSEGSARILRVNEWRMRR